MHRPLPAGTASLHNTRARAKPCPRFKHGCCTVGTIAGKNDDDLSAEHASPPLMPKATASHTSGHHRGPEAAEQKEGPGWFWHNDRES